MGIEALRILLGLVVLALGRRLFWLFVGVMGFLTGWSLASEIFHGRPAWILLLGAIGCGLLAALLAVFVEKLAIGLAGFLAGSYVSVELPHAFGWQVDGYSMLLVVIGGILGSLLLLKLFDWALIVLSTLAGATLIVQSVHLSPLVASVLLIALIVCGIGIQGFLFRR
ncbi:MAG TPA: DUF4203 domain-containing protein [Candidatus Methylomirabilis sp.]|nr:DUF4203 domain-containing protein [Candidatus Methylomirabilis sp.]